MEELFGFLVDLLGLIESEDLRFFSFFKSFLRGLDGWAVRKLEVLEKLVLKL